MTQLDVFLFTTDVLNRLGLNYMLTGAYAVSFYGRPRTTHDIDLNIDIDYRDVPKIYDAFKDLFYISKEMIEEAIKHQQMFNIIHNETQVKVDFWIIRDTQFDQERFRSRIRVNIHGQPVFIPTAEDTILTKLDWYKQSDIQKHYEDALGIFEIQQGKLDIDYLEKWAKHLSFLDIVEDILKKV